jgi:hypothetical protein
LYYFTLVSNVWIILICRVTAIEKSERIEKEAMTYFMGLSPCLGRGNEGKQENIG